MILETLTGLFIIAFIPVFSSYRGETIDKVEAIKKTYPIQTKSINELECSLNNKTKEEREIVYHQVDEIKQTYKTQSDEISALMKPVEQKRLTWLFIALALVAIGLPLLNKTASK